jgi:heme A synthase
MFGSLCGLLWGAVATLAFLAMFRGELPTPRESPLPVAILLYAAVLPFQGAIGLEVLTGRSSPGLAEIISLTVLCGVTLGALLGLAVSAVRMALSSGA